MPKIIKTPIKIKEIRLGKSIAKGSISIFPNCSKADEKRLALKKRIRIPGIKMPARISRIISVEFEYSFLPLKFQKLVFINSFN
jgi:hypothetical protein